MKCRLISIIGMTYVLMPAGLAIDTEERSAPPSPGKPNILLIVADDMGFSDASPYGGEIFTPNIASLAYQGAMFTNFHVAPTCTPTAPCCSQGATITTSALAT
jgi:hypothetical protein